MNYTTKSELRKSVLGFMHQRKHLYKSMKLPHMEQLCIGIEKNFKFIRDWSYWRHCLEVKNCEAELLMILPSQSGGHARIRTNMLELIAHCKQVSSMTKLQYDNYQASVTLRSANQAGDSKGKTLSQSTNH